MQAVLILAHKNFEQVYDLSALLSQQFAVYIHFDTKMPLSLEQTRRLDDLSVTYISTVDVRWGSWSIGEASRQLMALAMQDERIRYVHLISGECWPIKPLSTISDTFEGNDQIYMVSTKASQVEKSGESALNWQKFYFNYDTINRRSLFGKIYHKISYRLQALLKVDKLRKLRIDTTIYQGNNWCDLPRDAVLYCLDYLDANPNFLKMLETGFCSDEFWVQTILENNPSFAGRIVKNCNRFVKWQTQHGSYPAILDKSNLAVLQESEDLFARKLVYGISDPLLQEINRMIAEDQAANH